MGGFSWWHIIILAVVGVLLFGRRLPEIGRNVGRSIVEFKKGIRDATDDVVRQGEDRQVLESGQPYYRRELPPEQRPAPAPAPRQAAQPASHGDGSAL
ncbi:MAG: twin-arginine translocase TatA/TatE family subunit [Phycisphaerales bacterium]|nr:twin-arginine translocase TatA/TatE family subunit [Phycisphaerales bacterium]